MKAFLWFWPIWLGIGLAYEVWAVWGRKQGGDTLSEFTLYVFKANSTGGWAALMLLMGFLAAWFPNHVRHLDDGKTIKHTLVGGEDRPVALAVRPSPPWLTVLVLTLLAVFVAVLVLGPL